MDRQEQVIRLLIADDHAIVRTGFETLLADVPDVSVVATASDGYQAIQLARTTQPDVILLDLAMPRKTGLEAISDLKAVSPHSQILILTSYADDDKLFAAIKAGAIGFLLKEISMEDLLAAIRHAHKGLASLHPSIARRLIRELNRPTTLPQETLTDREAEILIWVARGLAIADIANNLHIHEPIVHRHINSILAKLRKGWWHRPNDPLDPPLPFPIPVR